MAPGQQAGSAILPAVIVLIESASGNWRTGWYASATALILIGLPAILSLIRVKRAPQSKGTTSDEPRIARDWTRAEVLRDPILYFLLAGTLAPAFVGTTIFFHQGYLIELRHYDPPVFVASFTVISVATIVFGLACGYDRRMEGAAKRHDSSANVKGEPLTCLPALQMIAVAAKARTSRL
jgi:MFS family permease